MFPHKIGSSPLQDDAVRGRLQQAILDDDSSAFRLTRLTLLTAHPEIADEHRLYGVLVKTAGGMQPVVVDETGQRIGGPGYVIAAGTPIDLLNVKYGESEMTVTIGDEIWKAPYKAE